jgi:4-amino-4-deoxy-L-arabinose transferase-like glycosyltransferase
VLVVAIVVAGVATRLPLLGGAQIDYDEGVYWESLRSMATGHPLYSAVYSSQPPAFLPLVVPFYALGHSIAAARSAMLVAFAVALLATYVATRCMLGGRAALVAATLLAVDPLVLRQSVTLQADGPSMALGIVALACAAAATISMSTADGGPSRSWRGSLLLVAAGLALAVAVLVKLNAVAFAVPIALTVVLAPGARRPSLLQAARRLQLVAAGGVLGAVAVLAPFTDRLQLVWSQSVGAHITARSLQEGGLTRDLALTLARESPFYLAALAGLAILLRRAPRLDAILVAWGIAVAVLSVSQRPLWPHHLLVAAPLVVIAAASPAAMPWRRLSPRAATGAIVAGVLGLGVAGMASGLVALANAFTADTHPDAVAALRSLTRPGDLVVSDDQFAVAAAGRDTPPELVDTAFVRLDSQHVTAADVESIIVREDVRAVYLATHRLDRLPGLSDWLRAHFPRTTLVGDGGIVYTPQ